MCQSTHRVNKLKDEHNNVIKLHGACGTLVLGPACSDLPGHNHISMGWAGRRGLGWRPSRFASFILLKSKNCVVSNMPKTGIEYEIYTCSNVQLVFLSVMQNGSSHSGAASCITLVPNHSGTQNEI